MHVSKYGHMLQRQHGFIEVWMLENPLMCKVPPPSITIDLNSSTNFDVEMEELEESEHVGSDVLTTLASQPTCPPASKSPPQQAVISQRVGEKAPHMLQWVGCKAPPLQPTNWSTYPLPLVEQHLRYNIKRAYYWIGSKSLLLQRRLRPMLIEVFDNDQIVFSVCFDSFWTMFCSLMNHFNGQRSLIKNLSSLNQTLTKTMIESTGHLCFTS